MIFSRQKNQTGREPRAQKRKKDAATLVILLFLAVVCFVTGISIQSAIASFYYESNERLQAPHYTISIPNNQYQEHYLEYLQQDSRVAAAQVTTSAAMYGSAYEANGGKMLIQAYFFSMAEETKISPLSLIEQTDLMLERPIYVPYFFKNNGYQIGDELSFTYQGTSYHYQVAGYFESTWFASSVNSIVFFYLPESDFSVLYGQVGGNKFLTARLYEIADIAALKKDFKTESGLSIGSVGRDISNFDTDFFEMQSVSTALPLILTVIMLAFSIIMFLIIILVVRFRIFSYLEDHMKSIGVMQAMGYTTRQIRGQMIRDYLQIALVGTLLGIAASYGVLSLLGNLIAGFMGVTWPFRTYLLINGVSLLLVFGMISLTIWVCSRKLKQITPVMALRGGEASYSFRQNHFPLTHKSGSFVIQLSMKRVAADFKQYLMIGIILVGVSAATSYACLLYSNMTGKDSAIYQMLGMESADVAVKVAKHQDRSELTKELMALEEVRAISTYYAISCTIEDVSVVANVSEDFNKLETVTVYQGDFPRYPNEIVITRTMAKMMGKEIGDTVTVAANGITASYIICGYTQTVNNLGITAMLTMDGIHRLLPAFEIPELNIYVADGYDVDAFIKKLEQQYQVLTPEQEPDLTAMSSEERIKYRIEQKITKLLTLYGVDSADYALSVGGELLFAGSSQAYQLERIDNLEILLATSVGSLVSMVAVLSGAILAITLLVIALILFLIIRYMILKQRQELGIMKALGYTSRQLCYQVALSFLPLSGIGIAVGCLTAGVTLNEVWNVFLQPLGISHLDFLVNPWLLLVIFIGLLCYVFFIALLSVRRIKEITVYELFSD